MVYIYSEGTSLKVNVMARLGIELTYYDIIVLRVRHCAT